MEIKSKVYSLELTQEEINNIEETFFALISNYNGKLGRDAIYKFKEDYPLLYGLYKKFQEKR